MQEHRQSIGSNLRKIKQLLVLEDQLHDGDERVEINMFMPLCSAKSGSITFCTQRKKNLLSQTQASVVITTAQVAQEYTGQAHIVEHSNPELAFAELLQHFFADCGATETDIHPSAIINERAKVAEKVKIGANAVIAADVVIESGVTIGPGVSIGRHTVIKKNTTVYANVSIYHNCVIGQACIIHSGACIGSDGFGYAEAKPGWKKIQHIGRVVLGDQVEIGSNTCVDRGMLEDTVIHTGTKIDNLCHIAHNVVIGKNGAIAACSGIAGSTTVGQNVMIGGGSGLNGQISITDNVVIGGATNIMSSIAKPGFYIGVMPAQTQKDWARSAIAIRRASIKTEQKSKA